MKIEVEIPNSFVSLSEENQAFVMAGLQEFCYAATMKYIQGQKEHGGNLWDRDCLAEVQMENIDQFWYLKAQVKILKDKINI